jgi:quinol monooxygenase YgiN
MPGNLVAVLPYVHTVKGRYAMAIGILALLTAESGRGDELGKFLTDGRELAAAEEGTVTWHAFKVDDDTFGVFDTFADEDGRQAHMNGELAARLGAVAPTLLAGEPEIKFVEILASK